LVFDVGSVHMHIYCHKLWCFDGGFCTNLCTSHVMCDCWILLACYTNYALIKLFFLVMQIICVFLRGDRGLNFFINWSIEGSPHVHIMYIECAVDSDVWTW